MSATAASTDEKRELLDSGPRLPLVGRRAAWQCDEPSGGFSTITSLKVDGRSIDHWPVTHLWPWTGEKELAIVSVGGFGRWKEYDKVADTDRKDGDVVVLMKRSAISHSDIDQLHRRGVDALIIVNDTDTDPKDHEDIDIDMEDSCCDSIAVVVVCRDDSDQLAGKVVTMQSSIFHSHTVWKVGPDVFYWVRSTYMQLFCMYWWSLLVALFSFLIAYYLPSKVYLFALMVMIAAGAYIQYMFKEKMEQVIRDSGHDFKVMQEALNQMRETKKKCGMPIPVWLTVILESLVEWVDPLLDGAQLGVAWRYEDKRMNDLFKASWEHVCNALYPSWEDACPGNLGLAKTLTTVLMLNAFVGFLMFGVSLLGLTPAAAVWKAERDLLRKHGGGQTSNKSLQPLMAKARAKWFTSLQGNADAANAPLLAHIFERMAAIEEKEAEKDKDAGQTSTRTASLFFIRVACEATPMLWLQISLFSIGFDKATKMDKVIALVSIATSTKTMATFSVKVLRDGNNVFRLWEKFIAEPEAIPSPLFWWLMGKVPINCLIKFAYPSLGFLTLLLLAASLLRLAGIFYCTSYCATHIFNLNDIKPGNISAGCFSPHEG